MASQTYHDYIQLNKGLDQLYHQIATDLGLSDSVLALLYTLWEEGDGLTPTRLYADWSLSKQTGHSALAWLKARDLVRLAPGREDRRSKGVYLTVQGQEYARRQIAPLAAAEAAAFEALTQEEQQTLVALTGKILCKLKEETAKLPPPHKETV